MKKGMRILVACVVALTLCLTSFTAVFADVSGDADKQPCTTHSYGAYKVTKSATVFATGSKQRTCSVCGYVQKVTIAKLTPTIKLSATTKTIKKGKYYTLVVSGMAKGDSVKSVVSSKKKVAYVSKTSATKYKIKGKKKGKATITVTLKSGKKKTCKVTIK